MLVEMRMDAWLREAAARLAAAGVESARLEAHVLAAHAAGRDRAWVLAHPEAGIPPGLDALLARRTAREPLAYILGYREFRRLRFTVTPSVLIPRQETETLVELVLERASPGSRVLDLGSGSGCIAISLRLERPDLRVSASDISAEALAVARANGEALGAEIAWIEADGVPGGAFDWIVSNPPYVEPDAKLEPEVATHEPRLAVFGTDGDGLGMYRRIAIEARAAARHAAVEIGAGQAELVTAVFEKQGWRLDETRPDIAGHPRALAFAYPREQTK